MDKGSLALKIDRRATRRWKHVLNTLNQAATSCGHGKHHADSLPAFGDVLKARAAPWIHGYFSGALAFLLAGSRLADKNTLKKGRPP
jgi:hypothetical protein